MARLNKSLPEFGANATGGVKVSNQSHLGKSWCCISTPRTIPRLHHRGAMEFRDQYQISSTRARWCSASRATT